MLNRNSFLLLICVFVFSGCSSQRLAASVKVLENSPLKEARVFQKEKLANGGKVLVVPFSAGEDVEASDELDHVSLMIVKGIADTLGPQQKLFKFLGEQDAQDADLVIRGRVVLMEEKSVFPKLLHKKTRKFNFAVEGLVLSVDTQEVLARFSQTKSEKSSSDRFAALGYDIGSEIGRFLLSNVQ